VAQRTKELADANRELAAARDQAEAAMHPFRQIDERMARKYEGSGLGLTIVKKLIESHHGVLTIVSTPGEGTEVSLFFTGRAAKPERLPCPIAA
jgi:signal transduction histidine kinase